MALLPTGIGKPDGKQNGDDERVDREQERAEAHAGSRGARGLRVTTIELRLCRNSPASVGVMNARR
jgi:hypothetical protein